MVWFGGRMERALGKNCLGPSRCLPRLCCGSADAPEKPRLSRKILRSVRVQVWTMSVRQAHAGHRLAKTNVQPLGRKDIIEIHVPLLGFRPPASVHTPPSCWTSLRCPTTPPSPDPCLPFNGGQRWEFHQFDCDTSEVSAIVSMYVWMCMCAVL